MLLHCPTCRSAIEAGPLPPGTTASCPFCQGLFQVPPDAVPPPQPPQAEVPAIVVPSHSAGGLLRNPPPVSEKPAYTGLATTLSWAVVFFLGFAMIGGGTGYLVFRFAQSQGESPAPPLPESPPSSVSTEADLVGAWRKIGQWRGTGPERTPPFRTANPRWRIQWIAQPRDPAHPDNFALHVTDVSGKQLQTPVSIVGAGNDTAYVSTRPGRYVLEVFTFGTDWEVTIEEPE